MDGKMWFGVPGHSEWIPAPSSGADVSPQGRGESGSLVGGGGFVNQSYANHKMYQFTWNDGSALQMAQKMRSYATGVWGRDRLLFVDPMTYHTNILPLQWSIPAMTVKGWGEYPSLMRSRPKYTEFLQTKSDLGIDAPIRSVDYEITTDHGAGAPAYRDRLWISVPAGMRLRMGAAYTASEPDLGVYWGVYDGQFTQGENRLTPLTGNETNLLPNSVNGPATILMWVGNRSGSDMNTRSGSLDLHFIQARLETISPADRWKMPFPWTNDDRTFYPGQGHSGCRPDGLPTMTYTSAVGEGQAGFSITLREVGSWEV